MKILVVGNGGREHALALAFARDPAVTEIHVAPGNPGIADVATLHQADPMDGIAIAKLATYLNIDLVVVGPEAPLVAGVADQVRQVGIACFGPTKAAAQLEGSKAFAKDVMRAAGVPTGASYVCETALEVATALDKFGPPYVVKDDNLAAGKGVVVTEDRQHALDHAARCQRVVIEEFLDGPEVSLFAICDGETAYPLQPAQDFKRIRDNDEGPNTGGMGSYTPLPWAPDDLVEQVMTRIVMPTLAEMSARGTPFQGLLFVGLALTSTGPRVIEFNARFGDPETQSVLALLTSPLGGVLYAAATGSLASCPPPQFGEGAAVTVVMASAGYPESSSKGDVIVGVDEVNSRGQTQVIQAGTAQNEEGQLVTAGGRVLAVTATGPDLAAARSVAYAGIETISFPGAQWRTDIGPQRTLDETAG